MAVAQPPAGKGGARQRGGFADPSLIIAAELAFDRLAVEKGQWTALARIVAKDAVLFQPGPVFAERWLKGRRDPSVAIRWQTQQVFMACDGSHAISTGIWVRPGGTGGRGWFTNIWRRDKQGYRLVLNHDGPLTNAPDVGRAEDELEAMSARIATCARRGRPGEGGRPSRGSEPVRDEASMPVVLPLDPKQPLPMSREDRADDGSLRWRWSVASDGSRILEAWMATEGGEALVLTDRAGVPAS